MAFHVRDPETDSLVRKLARREGIGLTEAVKRAVRAKLENTKAVPLRDRLRKIAQDIANYPDTGLKADKAFFDDIADE